MTIGQRIKYKRELKGFTLDELSKYAKVTRQTLSRYETGVISNIPSDKIELISNALDTTPAYLMGWEDKAAAEPAPLSDSEDIPLSESDAAILAAFRRLPVEKQELALNLLQALIDKQ